MLGLVEGNRNLIFLGFRASGLGFTVQGRLAAGVEERIANPSPQALEACLNVLL